jgi:hypothetical protein
MSRTLTQITNQNTFGVWKTRTNDIIGVLGDVVTIGNSETNSGNVVITGDISASGKMFVDTIQETTGNSSNIITVNANLGVEGNLILDQASALGKIEFQLANTPTWSIETSANHSTIDIKKGTKYLRVTSPNGNTAGEITGANIKLDLDLLPATGTIGLATTGNAGTATKWTTARTITLGGDLSGSVSIDGSDNVTLTATVADDSHTHDDRYFTETEADARFIQADSAVFTDDVTIPISKHLYLGKTSSDTDGYASIEYNASRELSIQMVDGSNASTPTAGIKIDLAAKNLMINDGSTGRFSFSGSSGNFVAGGDITAFGGVSDRNLKENIVKIDNALEKVSKISGYTFNYIGDDTPMTGVIAQELEEVLPEVVYETESPDGIQSKAVRHGNIVGLLIESIKELKAEIEELKKDK